MPRIVAGKFRGRVLGAPKGDATRPTQDRTKEALFSILGGDLTGLSAIDLYAGTGNLGLEALSRGAAPVTLVESSALALRAIEANIAALGVSEDVIVFPYAVEVALSRVRPADLIFMDPPYALEGLDDVIAEIFALKVLKPGGVLVVETSAKRQLVLTDDMQVRDERKYSDTKLVLLEWGRS
jgi:16S rRNA (guanine966-N2)-methyltransferase